MTALDLDSLEIFKAVVDYGSITAAAHELKHVQSNVSTRVKNLERRLGVMLFLRERGRLILSQEGKVLYTFSEKLLRLSCDAETALKQDSIRGTIRIGTIESAAAIGFPQIASSYHKCYPDVQIELVSGTSDALVAKIHRGDIEAAFVSDPVNVEGLDSCNAFCNELVLAVAANSAMKNPKELEGSTIITFASGCSYRRILESWMSSCGVTPRSVFELDSYHAIFACVAAGTGIALIPKSVLKAVHFEGMIKVLPLPKKIARSRTQLLWRSGQRNRLLCSLADEVTKYYKPENKGSL